MEDDFENSSENDENTENNQEPKETGDQNSVQTDTLKLTTVLNAIPITEKPTDGDNENNGDTNENKEDSDNDFESDDDQEANSQNETTDNNNNNDKNNNQNNADNADNADNTNNNNNNNANNNDQNNKKNNSNTRSNENKPNSKKPVKKETKFKPKEPESPQTSRSVRSTQKYNPYLGLPCSPRLFNTKIENITQPHTQRAIFAPPDSNISIPPAIKAKALKLQPLGKKPPQFYDALLEELKKDRESEIEKGNYKKIPTYLAAIEYVNSLKVDAQKQFLMQSAEQSYKEDLEAIKKALVDFDAETTNTLKEMNDKNTAAKAEFKQKQDADQKEFIAEWRTENKLRLYNHASQNLLFKRRQLALLYQSKKYDQLDILAAQIKELETKESEEAQYTMMKDFKAAAKKFKEKQKDDLEKFDDAFNLQKNAYIVKRNSERDVLLHMIRKVEVKNASISDQEKLWSACKMRRMTEELEQSAPVKIQKKEMTTPDILKSNKIQLPPLNMKTL